MPRPTPLDATTAVQQASTFLFVPGSRPDRFAKAAGTGADQVIADLEDAVAEPDKATAREHVARWLGEDGRCCVRVNAVDTPHHEPDVAALRGRDGLVAVVLPKAEDPAAVSHVAGVLDRPVVPIVETALGLHRVHELATAEGVARIAFGHLDYSLDLGSGSDREAMALARSTIVLASRLAGLAAPLDGVTPSLDEPATAGEDAAYALRMGFGGKLLIHPSQVAPARAALLPTQEETAWARRVLAADDGSGAVRVDGQMVDEPVLARARRILERAGKR